MIRISFLASLLILLSAPLMAIVIRHDVAEETYLADEAPPALVDMMHEGHGVLIAPQWVVTAAHVIFHDYRGCTINVGGVEPEIAFVIFHPGYSKPSEGLFTGDSGPGQAYLRANHDVALVKIEGSGCGRSPVENLRSRR